MKYIGWTEKRVHFTCQRYKKVSLLKNDDVDQENRINTMPIYFVRLQIKIVTSKLMLVCKSLTVKVYESQYIAYLTTSGSKRETTK